MTTHRAKVSFRFKELGADPPLSRTIEQWGRRHIAREHLL